jgi:uncharacterized protein
MVIDRRTLLTGLMVGAFAPRLARAETRKLYLSCRLDGAGKASVSCFDANGLEVFATSLPSRGHDAVKRPGHDDVVVFSRRPGDWFVVIDPRQGRLQHAVTAANNRAFYGHGAFSADGRLLFATENNTQTGQGCIGVFDATASYSRVDEFPSQGVGPHDVVLAKNGDHLLVANGGLRTDLTTGREEETMSAAGSQLVRIDARTGRRVDLVELDSQLKALSLRHLALAPDGTLAFGCQANPDFDDLLPLVGTISASGKLAMLESPETPLAQMKNYVGSVSFNSDGTRLAATSPHGNQVMIWSMADARFMDATSKSDVCGIAALGTGFLASSGNSGLTCLGITPQFEREQQSFSWIWDNHLLDFVV